ncbi:hypothetical protein LguiB_028153 [Lonicera macranthoides]
MPKIFTMFSTFSMASLALPGADDLGLERCRMRNCHPIQSNWGCPGPDMSFGRSNMSLDLTFVVCTKLTPGTTNNVKDLALTCTESWSVSTERAAWSRSGNETGDLDQLDLKFTSLWLPFLVDMATFFTRLFGDFLYKAILRIEESSLSSKFDNHRMDQEKIRSIVDWEVPKKERASSIGRLQGERPDAISLEREASRAYCRGDNKRLSRGDSVTVMNAEEWGILLVTVPMFRRTNAAGGVQNRPAEDGRERRKFRCRLCGNVSQRQQKGGGAGRLYSESMLELASVKMIIDAGSSDNIASTKTVDQLGLKPF